MDFILAKDHRHHELPSRSDSREVWREIPAVHGHHVGLVRDQAK